MSVNKLKESIKKALDKGSNSEQNLDNKIDADKIRESTADEISKAVQKYIKSSLEKIISNPIVTPQDGGKALQTQMKELIKTI